MRKQGLYAMPAHKIGRLPVGNIKKQSNSNILDSNREVVVLSRVKNQLKNQTLEPYVIELFETLMRVSKAYQK